MSSYAVRFENQVSSRLGGLDMADEFFQMHPECLPLMRRSALFHLAKGGSAFKGARIFFYHNLRPILDMDRRAAINGSLQ